MKRNVSYRPVKHLAPMLFLLAGAFALPRPAAATMLTLANATSCTQDDVMISCAPKTLVTMGVSYGLGTNLDVQYFDMVSERGAGEPQPLEETLRFEASKTQPKYIYPLQYLHTVAYAPREELRRIANESVGISSCLDGPTDENPSCGWTLDAFGNRIPDSQGFCANRDLLDLKTCGVDPSWWRGEEVIGVQSTLANSFAIAHCLRQGNLFYRGYEIDRPRRDYTVTTKVYKGAVLLDQISLSPPSPLYLLEASQASSGHAIRAELVGEAAPPVAPPDLSNYILYIPSSPADHPYVVDFQKNMLLVPREMVTADGSECNKVGVSFATFRNQAAVAPTTAAGNCLANQLFHLHQADLALLTENPIAETKYLVSGKKLLKPNSAFERLLALESPSPELATSTVNLTLDQAVVTSVRNEAVGYIKEAYAATFGGMTGNGRLVTVIKNAGTVPTDYVVQVTNCVPGLVGAIPAQARTLASNEEVTFDFDIKANLHMTGSHVCTVTLNASSGRKFDAVDVYLDTLAPADRYPWNLHLKNRETSYTPPVVEP